MEKGKRIKVAFLGFGKVNASLDITVRKFSAAAVALKAEGLDLVSIYPFTDNYKEKDIIKATVLLAGEKFDAVVVCIAGWIPIHSVLAVIENYKHLPMVLWGLCGLHEENRLVTTAEQARRTEFRTTFESLGYRFEYVYDIIGEKTKSDIVAEYCRAAIDFIVAASSFVVYDVQTGLFSLLGMFAKAFIVDAVIDNLNTCKYFVVITEIRRLNFVTSQF